MPSPGARSLASTKLNLNDQEQLLIPISAISSWEWTKKALNSAKQHCLLDFYCWLAPGEAWIALGTCSCPLPPDKNCWCWVTSCSCSSETLLHPPWQHSSRAAGPQLGTKHTFKCSTSNAMWQRPLLGFKSNWVQVERAQLCHGCEDLNCHFPYCRCFWASGVCLWLIFTTHKNNNICSNLGIFARR